MGLGAFDNRGRDFRTNDGTAITFRADADVHDRGGTLTQDATGLMMLPNGMLYRVDQNVVSRIRDRNGNQITFQYDASTRQVTSITDSLNRTYTVAYVTGVSDTITFKGYGGATRTIVVAYSDPLRANMTETPYPRLIRVQGGEMRPLWKQSALRKQDSRIWEIRSGGTPSVARRPGAEGLPYSSARPQPPLGCDRLTLR